MPDPFGSYDVTTGASLRSGLENQKRKKKLLNQKPKLTAPKGAKLPNGKKTRSR